MSIGNHIEFVEKIKQLLSEDKLKEAIEELLKFVRFYEEISPIYFTQAGSSSLLVNGAI